MDDDKSTMLDRERELAGSYAREAEGSIEHALSQLRYMGEMGHGSREVSLSITKLQEAAFWISERTETTSEAHKR